MIEFYPQIKSVHVAAVLSSGGLFLLRGLLAHSRHRGWARCAPVRCLSYAIDSVLLAAALALFCLLPPTWFANGWLAAKLGLLVVYIALGIVALREASSARRRSLCFVAALLIYALMVSIARAHHPLGVFLRWFS